MVAISLYRGNLHKVPDGPRRWPPPTPKISTKNFKILIRRRARALSRLRSSTTDAAAATSNPKPNPSPDNSDPDPGHADNASENNDGGNDADNPCSEPELPPDGNLKEGEEEKEKEEEVKEVKDDESIKNEDSLKKLVEKNDALVEEEGKELEVKDDKVIEVGDSLRQLMERTDALVVVEEEDKNGENVKNEEKKEVAMNPELEKSNTEDATIEVEKRKKEVKERLEILNEKKHGLVQVLKQILNAEEQLKRQNSTQGTSGRPPLPLQVDVTTDSGSVTRVNTPRLGSDGNPCADTDGGEADDVSNHITHSRHLPRMSSTSPSSDSQQRKPASNMVPHSYRTTIGVAGSPSRFAPGGQGHSSVSVSGTSYIASSPSPAASGGTSVFRDARLPSPWN
ncbi:hypothetical protein BUALT_Bualt07G0051100 [Buddleja alternifolia]|uniref:Uncharacterized protein n=1 Tax=Buddleja alternifolia TaxID=168488 RepID=A0AAV6XF00_9LAMI|nr:hypothetical protein BUALT_Bualt07G0051100 [Buddleja alternifolia]